MSQMFFGQFLLDEEVIGEDALQRAIDFLSEENSRVGALGIEKGYLTAAQVEWIQNVQRRNDARFADLAIALEMLTPEQANDMLGEQRRRHKPIGEALVELGCLEARQLDELLDRFHLSQLTLDTVHLKLPVDLIHDDLAPYLVEYLPKLFRRITQIPMKLEAGRPWIGRSNLPFRVSIEIEGDSALSLGIATCRDLGERIATTLYDPSIQKLDDVVIQESLVEFAEIFADAGRRCVRRDGLRASTGRAISGVLPKDGFWFPATTPFGRGILVLSIP